MKKIKNFILLFVMLFFASFVSTVSADTLTSETTGKITINGIKENVTVNAYRLIEVNVEDGQPKSPVYSWDDKVATWLKSQTNYASYVTGTNIVSNSFNNTLDNTKALATLYNEIENAVIKTETNPIAPISTKTADGTNPVEFTDMKMGSYLITISHGTNAIYNSVVVNLVPEYDETSKTWALNNKEVEVKSTEPSITKETGSNKSTTDVKFGESVPYEITVTVPNYKTTAKKKTITITDTLSAGLTAPQISGVEVYGKLGDTETKLTANSDNGYTITIINQVITISFSNTQYENVFRNDTNTLNYESIIVRYNATVNENALNLDSIKNTAVLTYNNDPDSETDQNKEDDVELFTYSLQITKFATENNEILYLAGAEFTISKAGRTLSFVKLIDGSYRLATSEDDNATTTLVSSEDGLIIVKGLDNGVYTIKETKAPLNYTKISSDVELEINDEDVATRIKNDKSFQLPVTGGIGTLLFSIVGITLMGLGAFLIKNISKKNSENNM